MWQVIAILSGALLAGGTSLCLGILLFRRFPIKAGRVEFLSLAFVAGSACFSQVVFFLCSVGLARRAVFLGIGVSAAAGAIGFVRRSKTSLSSNLLSSRMAWFLGSLFASFALVYLVNAIAPEMSPDGSAYHLPMVSRYLNAHGFQPIPSNFYASLPQAVELLFLPAFSLGGSSAAALMHLFFLFDLVLLMICYGHRFHFPVPAAVAAFLVFASPIVGWDAAAAYNDVAAAAILFALFYLLQIWDQERIAHLLIPIGILAGASYAVKYTAAIGLPYAIAFVAWKLWRGGKPLLRPLLTVSALAALIILPWMVKNAVVIGNPLAPFANTLFPNPYVHVSFEKQYLSNLRNYHLTGWFQAPAELTVRGERLQGFVGPIFLLLPIALLSLRREEGRRLLLAGAVFAAPWFLNIGTRFLIPALPPLAMALALSLSSLGPLLPAVALLHAFLSWYATPFKYFDSYAPRLASFPLRAALRIEPEDAYLARMSSGYLVDRLIEREVPPGEKIFSFDAVPEAWTSRQILIAYYSAENEVLQDTLWNAMLPRQCPVRALDLCFPARRLKGLRAIQDAPTDGGMWQISEFQIFSGNTQVLPDAGWDFHADTNPWDVPLAFDRSLVTRWQSWRPAARGMSLGVRFSEPLRIDQVRLLTTEDAFSPRIRLQGLDEFGNWATLPAQPSISSIHVTENLRMAATRALLDKGIRYMLVSPEAMGANEFYANGAAWGIQPVGESNGTRLYLLTGRASSTPPLSPVSLTPDSGAPPGTYDDSDPRMALHDAWMRDTQFQEPYGHTITYSNVTGASISFAFTGNSVTYTYTRSYNRGIAEIWIDNQLKDRVDLYAPVTKWKSQATYDVPGTGTHVIRIRVAGAHAPQAKGCFVDLDSIVVE
jgi:hypothetical protein